MLRPIWLGLLGVRERARTGAADAQDATHATDVRIEPALPMDRMDPALPMLRTLPKLKMLPTLAKLRILGKLLALNDPQGFEWTYDSTSSNRICAWSPLLTWLACFSAGRSGPRA